MPRCRASAVDDNDGGMLFLEEFLNHFLIPSSQSHERLPSLINDDSNKSSWSAEEVEAYVMAHIPIEVKEKLTPEVWKRMFDEASKSCSEACRASRSTSRTTKALPFTNHSPTCSNSRSATMILPKLEESFLKQPVFFESKRSMYSDITFDVSEHECDVDDSSGSRATSRIPDHRRESDAQPPVSFGSERSMYSDITFDISEYEGGGDVTELHSSLEDMIPQMPSMRTNERSVSERDDDSSSTSSCSRLQLLHDEGASRPSRIWNDSDGSLDYMAPLPQRTQSENTLPVFRDKDDDDKVEDPSQSSRNEEESFPTASSRSWDEDCSSDFVVSKPLRYESERNRRCVVFTTVQIRYYERILESHPCTSSGPSVGIGWNYNIGEDNGTPGLMNINAYESMIDQHNRRTLNELVLPREEREYMLKKEWGFTDMQIAQSIRRILKIKNQRRQTIHQTTVNPRIEKVEYALEKSKRRVSRMLGRRKGRLS